MDYLSCYSGTRQNSSPQSPTMIVFTVAVLCFTSLVTCQNNPPAEELEQCSQNIWAADTNSFLDSEIEYDLNGPDLFISVDETRLGTEMYQLTKVLLDNFNPQLGEEDPLLGAEIDAFLDAVLATGPMQAALACLTQWGFTVSEADFRDQLLQYWFLKFSRSGGAADDSSGFEHVFQGEIREGGGEVTGFHGWLQTYYAEQRGELVYSHSEKDCEDGLILVNDFTYRGASKSISSIWIGRSVEVEFALYSMCFMARQGQNCNIIVDGKEVTIINFTMSGVNPDTIGTIYAEC